MIGDKDDDWSFQVSSDLLNWANEPALGTLLSGGTATGPSKPLGGSDWHHRFYRARQTDGLYDPVALRTINLTFAQPDWTNLLTSARAAGTNVIGDLSLDNGLAISGIGSRYRGNTSFGMGGGKKSVAIDLDATHSKEDLMGYSSLNLNIAVGSGGDLIGGGPITGGPSTGGPAMGGPGGPAIGAPTMDGPITGGPSTNDASGSAFLVEPIYFTVMQQYTVCPKAAIAKLNINGEYWGVYSLTQNEDNDLIKEWFQGTDGDRWRAPNAPGLGGGGLDGGIIITNGPGGGIINTNGPGGGGPGGGFVGGGPGGGIIDTNAPGGIINTNFIAGGPGGGGFSGGSSISALGWLGTSVANYQSNYQLKKSADPANAWPRLVHAIDVLNNTPADQFRDKVEDVLDVDRWLWFVGLEILFADDDSYWNKGADYGFYYEPQSGRIHPIEHDGNEAFISRDVSLSPVQGSEGTNRPVIARLLGVPELRQRYLAHFRTVLEESFHPDKSTPLIDHFHLLSVDAIAADPKKNFTMAQYANALVSLKSFVTNRYNFLTNHTELSLKGPRIVSVSEPANALAGAETPVTAMVQAYENEGIDSVWLYFRAGPTGKFSRTQMFDDGAHGDGAAADLVFGAQTTGFLAGTKVRYYVEARSANAVKTAAFSPARAEQETYSFRVSAGASTPASVVINELMADNERTHRDPQGDFDDWIELRNLTDTEVDLGGKYLSDDPLNSRKWRFPDGTKISANGYLLVWADEDGTAPDGLHANFKLAVEGEQVLLIDSDANKNALLDSVTLGPQAADVSYGRGGDALNRWDTMMPTPGAANSTP
ncbi:MAG: CotH kinase family protein [Verrucomicrobiales bacterium]|nr:CotH kinase family protein [Verrucomicrobiales bacterium]